MHHSLEQHRLEQLRLAVALTHVVPGARLELTSTEGRTLSAGSGPSCELDLCNLRRVVLASAQRGLPDPSRYLAAVEIGGTLRPDAAGIHRSGEGDRSLRWFATLVPAGRVAGLLSELPVSSPAEAAVEAGIRYDHCLGVTIVRLGVGAGAEGFRSAGTALDRMALAAHGRCLVEELVTGGRIGSTP